MIHRRRILGAGIGGVALAACGPRPGLMAKSAWSEVSDPLPDEDLMAWIFRTQGRWDDNLYRSMLGAANEFKEGDAILGIAAESDKQRAIARQLLSSTRIGDIDSHPPFDDPMYVWTRKSMPAEATRQIQGMTLGELKTFLLDRDESSIHRIRLGLSSDVIACVTKLLNHDELIAVGAKVFNPLPGTRIGSRGYMGARIQPNSPTDHPDDIRWQVFNAFAYAVGDVLVGTNPVSSETESVLAVEETLRELLETFGIAERLPHCVLAHIDVQAEVERQAPGSTALWFQSIAGSDAANATFDVSLEKMLLHASHRTGSFGLYFETGQGADFTNGHGRGTDMLIHESRKYGLARGLTEVVSRTRQQQGLSPDAWVHLNDVAGFIGPEVFRSRAQLVRCCLEDIVMGKLHGLMIGLDVCTTLHMDVSLDDLGWCIDQIMPANPGYLMALPTRIDPMLGYLTTSFHDHVHVRAKFGYRVEDAMWKFYQELGVIDADGRPTEHFGDPVWVYLAYCKRKGDMRSQEEVTREAHAQIEQVRSRGVFIAQGYGQHPSAVPPELETQIHAIYDDAKACIWAELPQEFTDLLPVAVPVATRSIDRNDYILHPTSGEELAQESLETLAEIKDRIGTDFDTVLVVSDGLNALAVTSDDQCLELLSELRRTLKAAGFRVTPEHLLVRSGRVRAGYRIGETLFAGRSGPLHLAHVIGERPGSGHRTLSIYMTSTDGSQWSVPGTVDHNITKVVSGIARTTLRPDQAAEAAARILLSMA